MREHASLQSGPVASSEVLMLVTTGRRLAEIDK